MSGLFGVIYIGVSGLLAHQRALGTISHNLANVDTPGYRRQDAVLAANPPLPPAGSVLSHMGGQLGTGVSVGWVRRANEAFLSLQSRLLQASVGDWSERTVPLRQAEAVIAPATGDDLRGLLDGLWDAWEAVANKPEDLALRAILRETAAGLANTFRDMAQRLQALRMGLDDGIVARVKQVNALAREVAELNRQIAVAQAEARAPNDLLDRRDVALDRLAALCGATPLNSESGHLIVYLDGRPLVQGASVFSLSTTTTEGGMVVRSGYDGGQLEIAKGEIGGLRHARDASIPDYLAQLDALALSLAAEVNARHRAGFDLDDVTGRDFFAATGAGDIALDPAVAADVRAIAAAGSAGAPGDGSVALGIANLRATPLAGGRSLGEIGQALLGAVGQEIAMAEAERSLHQSALDQVWQQQQSAGGVSIDEELAQLVQSQRAYEAAARVITAADELLRLVIERMGVA